VDKGIAKVAHCSNNTALWTDGVRITLRRMTLLEELQKLYPSLSQHELQIAKENLDRYLLLAWEIIEEHKQAQASNGFSEAPSGGTMEGKVDSPQKNKLIHPNL